MRSGAKLVTKTDQIDHFWHWIAQRTVEIETFGGNPELYVAQHDPKSDHFAQYSDAFGSNIRLTRGSKWYPKVSLMSFGAGQLNVPLRLRSLMLIQALYVVIRS